MPPNAVTVVPIHTGPTFGADTPTKLFDGGIWPPASARSNSTTCRPDGQRFLMIKDSASGDQASARPSIVVVVNWFEELKAKLGANR